MNKEEASQLLRTHLDAYRSRSYEQLVAILEQPQNTEIHGPSGATYQVEVQVFWDSRAGEAVRVLGSIDDRGWRAFVPLSDDFIMAPTGRLVGE